MCVRIIRVQTMVDCEVWERGKCEKRTGCENERRTDCEGERRTVCEGEKRIINISQTIIPRPITFFRKCTPLHTPSLPPQFLLLLMW